MSNLIVLKYPSIKKTEAEAVKTEMEKAGDNISVVLVDADIEVQVLPVFN